MTENQPEPESSPNTPASREGSLWSVLAPAGALLVGLVLGGVLVGVVGGSDEPSADPSPSSSETPGEGGPSSSEGAMMIMVPDECLAAVDSVETALNLVERGAGAIRDFEPDELRSLLRELEELDAEARAQADACRDVQTVE